MSVKSYVFLNRGVKVEYKEKISDKTLKVIRYAIICEKFYDNKNEKISISASY